MHYDLYGNRYSSKLEALNAEMAQCARIDARGAVENANNFKKLINKMESKIEYLTMEIEHIEQRLIKLEEKML